MCWSCGLRGAGTGLEESLFRRGAGIGRCGWEETFNFSISFLILFRREMFLLRSFLFFFNFLLTAAKLFFKRFNLFSCVFFLRQLFIRRINKISSKKILFVAFFSSSLFLFGLIFLRRIFEKWTTAFHLWKQIFHFRNLAWFENVQRKFNKSAFLVYLE